MVKCQTLVTYKNRMSVFRPGLFKGCVAIVTGGATGIGRGITYELLTLGMILQTSLI